MKEVKTDVYKRQVIRLLMILILVNTFSTMIMRHSKLGLFNLMQTALCDVYKRQVLDRATTIEFSYVDLVPDFEEVQDAEACEVTNDFLKSEYIVLKKDLDVEDQNFVIKICSQLQSINEILQEANSHVGYRVRDEIVFYMLNKMCIRDRVLVS